MDCEWNFKSQTLKHVFAESNNQNKFLSAHGQSIRKIKSLQFHFYKTCNKKIDLQKKRINRLKNKSSNFPRGRKKMAKVYPWLLKFVRYY